MQHMGKEYCRNYFKEYRKKRREAGKCIHCGRDSAGMSKCMECAAKYAIKDARHGQVLKDAAFCAYGGYKCVRCGETKKQFLCLDHINNDGAAHRKELSSRGKLLGWLKKNNYPPGFQVLCWNCNHIKAMSCRTNSGQRHIKYAEHVKARVFNHYGISCMCCKENNFDLLTIDHINGNGKRSREQLKISTTRQFYSWIISNNYPDNLRTLCFNCNSGRYINGGPCPHEVV